LYVLKLNLKEICTLYNIINDTRTREIRSIKGHPETDKQKKFKSE